MNRIFIHCKDAADALSMKEIVIDEKGEMLQTTDIINFDRYYEIISKSIRDQPDMVIIDLSDQKTALDIMERMGNIKQNIVTSYIIDKNRALFEPITMDKVLDAVNCSVNGKKQVVSFGAKGREVSLDVHRIIYIESRKHNVFINEEGVTHNLRMKMSECLAKMPESIIRIHQSYAVNVNYIDSFHRDRVRLVNGETLSVSRRYAMQAKDKWYEWIGK